MNPQLDNQYTTGLSRHNIQQALVAAGKDLDHVQPADLGMLEDFHTLGRLATSQLSEVAEIGSHDEVLDAGTPPAHQASSTTRSHGPTSPRVAI